MNIIHHLSILGLVGSLSFSAASSASDFVALSLRQAAARVRAGTTSVELEHLAGITRIAGLVLDPTNNDIIIIGASASSLPGAHFDDLVTALRARLIYDEWPLVSIDPTEETERTGLQIIRFDGHLEDSRFGAALLLCDILLKRYSMQALPEIAEVRSYRFRVEEDLRQAAETEGATIVRFDWFAADEGASLVRDHSGVPVDSLQSSQARFRFYVMEPYVPATRQGMFCIKQLRIGVQSEQLGLPAVTNATAADRYCGDWNLHFEDMCVAFPELRQLKLLYDLVAVAQAVRSFGVPGYLQEVAGNYRVAKVSTARTYRLEECYGLAERADSLRHLVRLSGGIQLRPEVRLLNRGDITPLRAIVLKARPAINSLSWPLPLAGWEMPNGADLFPGSRQSAATRAIPPTVPGCYLSFQSAMLGGKDSARLATGGFSGFPPLVMPLPQLKGVSFYMPIGERNFRQDTSGQLRRLKEQVLHAAP